jgi:NADP-dependent 3-hydroxy acid dehydrogenase YdfG
MAGVILGGTSTMGILGAFTVGFVAFNAGIALLLAARREESLHRLANDSPAGLIADSDGTDGSL